MRSLLTILALCAASAHPLASRCAADARGSRPSLAAARLRGGYAGRYNSRYSGRYGGGMQGSLLPTPESMADAERVYVLQQFARPEVRTRFLATVYRNVFIQVLLTVALVAMVRRSDRLILALAPAAPAIFLLAWIPAFALQLSSRARQKPRLSMLLLLLFTALTGVGLGATTALLPLDLLLRAGGVTLLATASLTLYAMNTRRDFTAKRGLLAGGMLGLLALSLLQLIFRGSLLSNVQVVVGVLVFSAYLVHDTQQVVGGGKAVQLRPDEHVLGALNIYTDLLNLFLYVLRAMAMSERD